MAMNLGEASARITLDVSDVLAKSAQAQGALTNLDGAVGKTGSGFSKFADGMAGLGASMLPVIGIGLNFAMDMEQAMADVNASLGGVDVSVLEDLEQGFLDIGAASQFSAVEVAAVGDEIARAGFDTDKIIGMTQAVVDLTQATGTDLMTAVSGVTAVMQIWSPAIVDADIALTDAARAADVFTVAANASSADVQDIIAGMRNFGPTAASIGIGFDEASAAIALFTNYGLKAADSGVSLTRAIENLQNPTAEAQAVMDEFGITIFDMQGNFVGLPALFDQLNLAFADMTPAARNAALSTLFGAEALDVMTIAALTGGDPIRAITAEMEGSGQAAEQSALRMNTLKAQLGELFESATNLAGRLVGGLMPGLRGLVDLGNMAVDALSRLPQSLINITGVVIGLVAAFGALRTASAVLGSLNRFTGGALGSFGLRAMIAPFLLMTAVIGGAYLAIRSNFLGIGDAVDRVAGRMRFLYNVFDNLRESGVDPINAGFVALGRTFPSLANGTQALARMWNRLSLAAQEVASRVDMLGEHFRYFTRLGVDPVNAALLSVGRVFPDLADEMQATQRVVNDLTASWRDFRDQGVGPVSAAFLALGTVFPAVQTAMQGLAGVTENLGDAFLAAVQGDWSQALEEVGMAARGAWVVIQELAGGIGGLVANLWDWTINVGVPAVTGWIADNAGDIGSAILAAGGWVLDNIIAPIGTVILQIGGWLVEAADSAWEYVKAWVLGQAGGIGGAGGAAGGAAVRAAGGSIPIGPVALVIQGWLVELGQGVQSVWDSIVTLVTGNGPGGSAGMGRGAGIGLAGAAGIPYGPVKVTILGFDIEVPEGGLAGAIDRKFREDTTLSDADLANYENYGREAGRPAGQSFVRGFVEMFGESVESGDGGGAGGGGGVSGNAGMRAAASRFVRGFFEGFGVAAMEEMDTSGADLKDKITAKWNEIMPGLLDVSVISDLQATGGITGGGLASALGVESSTFGDAIASKFDGFLQEFQTQSDSFQQKLQSMADGIDWEMPTFDMPDIEINWPDPPEIPPWLKQLFTDPAGFIRDQVTGGSNGEDVGAAAGEPNLSWWDTMAHGADRVMGALKTATGGFTEMTTAARNTSGAVTAAAGAATEASTGFSIISQAANAAGSTLSAWGSQVAGAILLARQPLMAVRTEVESLGATLAAIPPATVTVTADTTAATMALGETVGAMAALNGTSSTVLVNGDNSNALSAVSEAGAAIGAIAGMSAMTYVNGDNSNALGAVMGAAGAMAAFDGTSATGYIYAESFVQAAVDSARAALASIDGASATVSINTVGGAGVTIGQKLATGGYVRSQYQLVGERGPEIVSLPYGAYVHPTGTGPQQGGGNVYVNATITGADSWSTGDRRAFVREFATALRDGVDIVYTSHGATT